MHKDLHNIKGDEKGLVDAEFLLSQKMSWAQVNQMVEDLRRLTFGTKRTILLPDFDSRPIVFDPQPNDKIPNNAIIVSTSYPYGRHRCLRACWLERDKKGDYGFTYVTSSFGGIWNTPKRGTKTRGIGYFCEGETNGVAHISHNVFDISWKCYDNGRYHFEPLENFLGSYGNVISEDDKKHVDNLRSAMAKYNQKAQEKAQAVTV
ncbi:MAG TPA: hypothetical protein PLP33_24740 [Leptospiraceae bacterium]|nr:hypothetical protein [Leptospiraceae bacterium]